MSAVEAHLQIVDVDVLVKRRHSIDTAVPQTEAVVVVSELGMGIVISLVVQVRKRVLIIGRQFHETVPSPAGIMLHIRDKLGVGGGFEVFRPNAVRVQLDAASRLSRRGEVQHDSFQTVAPAQGNRGTSGDRIGCSLIGDGAFGVLDVVEVVVHLEVHCPARGGVVDGESVNGQVGILVFQHVFISQPHHVASAFFLALVICDESGNLQRAPIVGVVLEADKLAVDSNRGDERFLQ